MKSVFLTVWKEQAKMIAEDLGLRMVGDKIAVNTKVVFTKLSAEGRHKVGIRVEI